MMKQGLDQLNESSMHFQRLKKDYAGLVKVREDYSKRAKECGEVLKQIDRIDGKDNLDTLIKICEKAELLLKWGLKKEQPYKKEIKKEVPFKPVRKERTKIRELKKEFEIPFSKKTGWKRSNYIYVPRIVRANFPGFKEYFTLKTNVGDIETHLVGASAEPGDKEAGNYFSENMAPWFEHNRPRIGDNLLVKVVKLYKEYKINLKRK